MNNNRQEDRYRFVVGGLVIWAYCASGVSFSAISPILPIITDDYDIGHAAAGILVGVVSVVWGTFGLPGGLVVGWLGIKRTVSIGWFLTAAVSLTAFSPNFEGLIAIRVAFGLGMAILIPATGPLIMQWFRPKEMPIITSLNMASVTLGMVVAMATVVPLADAFGWQRAMGLFGVFGLIGAFAWLVWGKAEEETGDSRPIVTWAEIRTVIGNRTVLLMAAADAAAFSQYMVLSGWLPTFYNETRDMTLTEAGFITSLLPFAGIFGVLLGGLLPLKVESKRIFFIAPGVMIGVGGLGTFLVDNAAATYFCVMLVGMGSWLYIPVFMILPMELPGMTPQRVALVWGWIMGVTGLASFVAPLGVGAWRDASDTFIPGFIFFAVLSWVLFIVGFKIPETRAKRPQPADTAPSPTPAPE